MSELFDPAATGAGSSSVRARAALRLLLDGNRRFVAGSPLYPRDISAARAAAAQQRPVAAVFTCVDSRVTAESLFDCDFGQLIVVRTAGHVLDDAAAHSLDFAVEQLNVPLVVVLGHQRCGAVALAVDGLRDPDAAPAGFLADELSGPAGEALDSRAVDPYRETMCRQVTVTVSRLRARPAMAAATVRGAHYDLDDGTVRLAD